MSLLLTAQRIAVIMELPFLPACRMHADMRLTGLGTTIPRKGRLGVLRTVAYRSRLGRL
jgi:hypothetical protein